MTLTLIGAVALTLVLVVAVRLLVTAKSPDDSRAQFGRPLLVGAIVGLTFMPAQAAIQAELRSQDENLQERVAADAERRELLLQLTLRRELPGIDLRGEDLSGVYMYRKNLSGANLRGANLRNANLAYVDLRNADLSHARFAGANLTGARFEGATLKRTSFVGADLRRAKFSMYRWPVDPDIDLLLEEPRVVFRAEAAAGPPADFSKAVLHYATFEKVDLSHARFVGADLTQAKFTDAILHGADFDRTNQAPDFLSRVDLCRASFRGAHVDYGYYDEVSLRNADLEGARMEGDFSEVDFRGANTAGLQAVLPEEALYGWGVVQTRGAPELSPALAAALGAVSRRPVPADECHMVFFRNQLRPLASELPNRRFFGS